MKIYECQLSRSFTDFVQDHSVLNNFKHLLRNHLETTGTTEAKFHEEPPWDG